MTDVNSKLDPAVTDYWLKNYADNHCTLCGNHGYIDSRGVCTPAGLAVGRLNYCVCPNGQVMRELKARIPEGGRRA